MPVRGLCDFLWVRAALEKQEFFFFWLGERGQGWISWGLGVNHDFISWFPFSILYGPHTAKFTKFKFCSRKILEIKHLIF